MTDKIIRMKAFAALHSPSPTRTAAFSVLPEDVWQSHAPIRPVPVASDRAFDEVNPDFYLAPDAAAGGNGSEASPWKTFAQAAAGMSSGDVLYLRGAATWTGVVNGQGIHWGIGNLSKDGITVRCYPGEIAVVTPSTLREFWDDPQHAWEEAPGGVEGEFRSVNTYPWMNNTVMQAMAGGHFGDSMLPLFHYKFLQDLRATNEFKYDHHSNFGTAIPGLYCGPGIIWVPLVDGDYNPGSLGHFHIRLAHTAVPVLDDLDYLDLGVSANYTGEEDPRVIPLLLNFGRLTLRGNGLTVQDIVLAGGGANSTQIGEHSETNIEIDGIHYYHGCEASGLLLRGASSRLTNTKLRGQLNPWNGRFGQKNRGDAGETLCTVNAVDVDVDHCEFTDGHDGGPRTEVQVLDFDFHHNFIDNMADDGFYQQIRHVSRLVRIYQNHIQRCNQMLPFTSGGAGVPTAPEIGAYICRNFFDLRPLVNSQPPRWEDPDETFGLQPGQFTMEHGNSVRPNVFFYHNDIALLRRDLHQRHMANWGKDYDSSIFKIWNNALIVVEDTPAQTIDTLSGTYDSRKNLQYSMQGGAFSVRSGDIYGDPLFTLFTADWRDGATLSVAEGSPARLAGEQIPTEWFDPLRDEEENVALPTIGAVPYGASANIFGPGAEV